MRLAPRYFGIAALSFAPRLAAAQTATPPEDTVRLHVDGPKFAQVLGRATPDDEWTPVCSAPCDSPVPLDWEYQVKSHGMKPSPTFQLDAADGENATVRVHPAYSAWFVGGIVALSTGTTLAVVGLPAVVIEAIRCGPVPGAPMTPGYDGSACEQGMNAELGVVAVVSASLIALGAVAAVTNQSTTVTQDDPTDARRHTQPVWHTAERRDGPPLPPTLGAPLLTLQF